MKKLIAVLLGIMAFGAVWAQGSGSITVGGDIDKFYPVLWMDGGYILNKQTELHIGRSSTHADSQWRGSMIASFYFHTTNWGNGSSFLNAHIVSSQQTFVAGWTDPTSGNSIRRMIIWLKGGGTTYHFDANIDVSPAVYDGAQNALPFTTPNGVSFDIKTSVDNYVYQSGTILEKPLHVRSGKSAIMGNLGIGISNPTEKLEVNGNIRAHEIKLEASNWPDYVFDSDYHKMTLEETKAFINENGHLPGFKSAEEYKEEGVNMMELNQKLLEKIEELTLYTIHHEERFQKVDKLEQELNELKQLLLK